jgi:hypothetical protein
MNSKVPVVCPNCHSTGQVPVNFAGHTIHCKKCDTHFTVPSSHPASPQHETPAHEIPHLGQAVHAASAEAGFGIVAGSAHHDAPRPATNAPSPQSAAKRASLLDALSEMAPPPKSADNQVSLLDALSEDSELAPLTPDDEKHCRERYEARVLSKDRSAHYDDNGNLLSDEELARKTLQKRSHEL